MGCAAQRVGAKSYLITLVAFMSVHRVNGM